MKIAALILLVANVVFFGWSWQHDATDGATSTPAAESLQKVTAQKAAANQCRSLGPFVDSTQIVDASAALAKRGVATMARQYDRKVGDGIWVYIDGLTTAKARDQAIVKLRLAGVRDVVDVTNAGFPNRISAGVFVETAGANDRADRVRRAGFDPIVEERKRSVSERWLNAEFAAGSNPPSPAELGIPESIAKVTTWIDCPVNSSGG